MKHIVIVVLVALLVSGGAYAAQFGLQSGESYEQISKVVSLKKVKPFIYSTPTLPNGNVAFNDYRLIITPKQGLCKIIAWTPNIESSVYGDGVKDKFSALFEALTNKYGKGQKIDTLRPGSIWDDPRDWMMGLAKNERFLTAIWTKKHGDSLPPDIQAIALTVHGVNSSHALISLGYEFTNFDSCLASIKAAENSSL